MTSAPEPDLAAATPASAGMRADVWLPVLYDSLHELAARELRREPRASTLQPTALAHEAYLRLADSSVAFREEAHFLALASSVVRQVLVDHARRRRAQKRGGGWRRVTLHPDEWPSDRDGAGRADADRTIDLLALDEALGRLERANPRAARVVELLFFGGLSIDDAAQALGVSSTTVDVDWRFARAWLCRELEAEPRAE